MYLPEQKQCSYCKKYLKFDKFYIDNSNKLGLSCRCKECKKKTRYLSNKTVSSYQNNIIQLPCNPITNWSREALRNSKKRAKVKGLQHNLTRQWLIDNLPINCPVLNVPLVFGHKYYTPSLDRFDNNKGYTTDNVRVISYRANVLKNNATLEELEAIVRYMKDNK